MRVYKTKIRRLTGDRYSLVYKRAYRIYMDFKRRTKRRPYVRSAYFNKEKIFLNLFWHHLDDKVNFKEKVRRLWYFPCALDLIQNSKCPPTLKQNPNKELETLYRFFGITAQGEKFCVQIKENTKNKQKYLMSVFPKK